MDFNDNPSLNLSLYADNILHFDKGIFMNDSNQPGRFINKVLSNYWQESKAVKPTGNFNYQGDVKLRVRLNQELYFAWGEMLERPYNKNILKFYSYDNEFSPAKLVAAILEEYAQLPFVTRERIFYKEVYKTLSRAIVDNNSKKNNVVVCKMVSGKMIKIYPVRICMDEWSTHNYLTGLVLDNKSGELVPTSMRLSKIESIIETNDVSDEKGIFGDVGDKHIISHNEALKKYGVMFLNPQSKTVEAKIRFTESGKNNYNVMSFMRPPYVKLQKCSNGGYDMIFNCTERQIMNYFRKFGNEIEVLEPRELREEFKSFFAEAHEMYNNSKGNNDDNA